MTLVGLANGSSAGTAPEIGVRSTPPEAALAMVTETLRLLPVPIEVCATLSESEIEKPELLAAIVLVSGLPGDTSETVLTRHLLESLG